MTATTSSSNSSASLLRDSRHGCYYNRDLGGFSETDPAKATSLDSAAQVAFVKAHFQHPEFIEVVPASRFATPPTPALDAPPTPDNAHLNQHINGSAKLIAHPVVRWDERTYTFGAWHITCYKWNQNKGAHPYLRSTRPNYVPMWNAFHAGSREQFSSEDGGIKLAVKKIIRHEMRRHGLA